MANPSKHWPRLTGVGGGAACPGLSRRRWGVAALKGKLRLTYLQLKIISSGFVLKATSLILTFWEIPTRYNRTYNWKNKSQVNKYKASHIQKNLGKISYFRSMFYETTQAKNSQLGSQENRWSFQVRLRNSQTGAALCETQLSTNRKRNPF